MALIKCPECNHSVSSHATHCPNCGCPIEAIKTVIVFSEWSIHLKAFQTLILLRTISSTITSSILSMLHFIHLVLLL